MPKTATKKTPIAKAVVQKNSGVGKKRERLILLDAHAIIHRAYHALPDFSSPSGEPSGALYGLSSMLLRIIADLKPDYIAACYDLPKPTMRHEAYPAYKGTRAKIDEALITQIISSRKVFEAFSIPIYEKEGFEADDILGTISHLYKDDHSLEIIIASGDMDTLQLVDKDRVKVYTLKKGITDTILYDEKAVRDRFGFDPILIQDFKGLRGDPSDNIIGIPGIGEKTATDLIVNFGSIEKMYKTLKKDEKQFLDKGIKPRIIELLKTHEEDAIFSKMLATIRLDAPIKFKLPEAVWKDGRTLPKILALFDEYGFRSIRERAKTVFHVSAQMDESGEFTEDTNKDDVASPEDIPEETLRDAKVLLWLLASDFTNSTLEDMLSYTRAQTFAEAYVILKQKVKETGRLQEVYETIEKPLSPVLRKMEERGVLIDRETMATLAKKYRAELESAEKQIYSLAGHEFTISSPRQLGDVLFDELGLKAKGQKKTATGQRSTRESELEKNSRTAPNCRSYS